MDANVLVENIETILMNGNTAEITWDKDGVVRVKAVPANEQNAPERPQEPENISHPKHYSAGGIECIDAIEAAIAPINDPIEAFLTGQVIKYIWRFKLKNGLEDLHKAKWYLDRLIEKEKQNEIENKG